jgi:hypothetical protein
MELSALPETALAAILRPLIRTNHTSEEASKMAPKKIGEINKDNPFQGCLLWNIRWGLFPPWGYIAICRDDTVIVKLNSSSPSPFFPLSKGRGKLKKLGFGELRSPNPNFFVPYWKLTQAIRC